MLTAWEPPSTAEAVSLLYQLGPQQETEFNSDGSKVEALRKGLAPGDKQPVAGGCTAPQCSSLLREYTLGHTSCVDLSRRGGEGRTSQQEGSVGPRGVCSKRHRDGCFPCTQKPSWIGRTQRSHQ